MRYRIGFPYASFNLTQTFTASQSHDIEAFVIDGLVYLAVLSRSYCTLYLWNGDMGQFATYQVMPVASPGFLKFFSIDYDYYLALTSAAASTLFKWCDGKFIH